MLFHHGLLVLSLAASSVLIAGCQSARRGNESEAGLGARASLRGSASRVDQQRIEAHARYTQAVMDDLRGDAEAALLGYAEAALHDPGNEQLVLEVSRRCIQGKRLDKALELLIRATGESGASSALFARLGFIQAQLGNMEEAVSANRTAVRRDPRSLLGYQNLFLIHQQSQKPREALEVLNDAAGVSNVTPEFQLGIAEMYGSLGLQNPSQKEIAVTRGLALLERVRQAKPTDPQLRMRMADSFNLLGKEDEAAKIYQELLADLPDVPIVRDNLRTRLAEIYLRNPDDHVLATQQLEQMLRDNPADPQIYLMLGAIAMETTNFVHAADHFSKAVLLNPNLEGAHQQLARAQLAQNQTEQALASLEKARQRFPQNFMLEYLSGLAYSQRQEYTNAIHHFTAAELVGRATDPKRLDQLYFFFFEFGAVLERAGRYEEAEKHFEKCLELSPNYAAAQNYLGYMLAERGVKLDRARDLIERAIKAEPENAAYLDSMAWVLFKLNRPQEALPYLLDALKYSEEEDAVVYDHLGDIYSALKETEKALEAWRKSLSLEPNEAVKKKVEPVLAR